VGCQATGADFTCADLHSALEQAKTLSSKEVVVKFMDTFYDGPFKVVAPTGPGSLTVDGGGVGTIDGLGNSTLLGISGGTVTITGVSFINGWVNATHPPKGAAAVSAQAHSNFFVSCNFMSNYGFDGGAVLAYHNFLQFTACYFKGNVGYGGGDGGAHDTGGGGAICMVGSTLQLLACVFEDNIATDPPPSTGIWPILWLPPHMIRSPLFVSRQKVRKHRNPPWRCGHEHKGACCGEGHCICSRQRAPRRGTVHLCVRPYL
jgi:hypothetical protein